MIVAIYLPQHKAVFFKGWTPRRYTEPWPMPTILTTPDLDKAKDLTAAMADHVVARLAAVELDALALATGRDALGPPLQDPDEQEAELYRQAMPSLPPADGE